MGKRIFVLIIIFLLAIKCSIKIPDQSNIPTWMVDINIPIGEETLYIEDILDDSLIVMQAYGNLGDSILAIQDTSIIIEKVEVGDKLKIDDVSVSFTQGIDEIVIDDVQENFVMDLTDVSLESVSAGFSSEIGVYRLDDTDPIVTDPTSPAEIYDLSVVPEGTQADVPQALEIPSVIREINFTKFSDANFSNGFLDLTIFNNMVIELGSPIIISILDSDSTTIFNEFGDSLKILFDVGILPSTSSTRSINLQNHSLPGNVLVKIDGVLSGSGPTTITNNEETRNSSFYVEVTTREIEITSANAIIPSQEIDTSNVILIPETTNKIVSAKVKKGNLKIDIANEINLESYLVLEITSLDTSDLPGVQPFTKNITIPASDNKIIEYSLSNYSIVIDVDRQEIDYNYRITTKSTEPEKVEVNSTDNIDITFSFYGESEGENITFSEFEGLVNQDPITMAGEIDITTDSELTSATIADGSITIDFINNVSMTSSGIPVITLSIPELLNSNSQPFQIGPIALNPGTNNIIINDNGNSLEGYQITPLKIANPKDTLKQIIRYNALIEIPNNEIAHYNLQESFEASFSLDELHFSQITGFFNQEAITYDDSISFEENHKIKIAKFSEGNLVLNLQNNLGITADIDFIINEIVRKDNRLPLTKTIQLREDQNELTENIDLSAYQLEFPDYLTTEEQSVHYKSVISIPSDEEMTINLDQNIICGVELTGLKFLELEGYIDTIEVEMEEVEEVLDDFPDEIEDLDFENIDISIEFDTNLGVDFVINFNLKSFNDDGDSVVMSLNHTVLHDDIFTHILEIPDAEDLINIKPTRLKASGTVKVGGNGIVSGDQYVGGKVNIFMPLSFIIKDDVEVDLDPEFVKEEIPDQVEAVTIFTEIINSFDISGTVNLLTSKDTLNFDVGSLIKPDTLLTFSLKPNMSFSDEISLTREKFDLIQDSCYIKPIILLDKTELGETVKFLKSDSIKVFIYGTLKAKIKIDDEENDQE